MSVYVFEMSNFGKVVRELIEDELHETQREFVERAGFELSTLQRILKMKTAQINQTTYRALAAALKLTPSQLDSLWRANGSPKQNTADRHGGIPVFGYVPASNADESLCLYQAWGAGDVADEYLPRSALTSDDPHAFAFKVRGACMEPVLHNGDTVIASPAASDDKIKPGDICLVLFAPESDWPDMMTIKRVWKQRDGTLRLTPDNPNFKPMIIPREHVAKLTRIVKRVSDVR